MTVWEQLFTKRMLICVFTGFTSGLPLFLLFNLLPAWLRSERVDLNTIGLFALIQFPYTWKFLAEISGTPGKDLRPEVARRIIEAGADLYALTPVGLSLEEVFLQLTREEAEAQEAA